MQPPYVPWEGTRGEGNKAAALEATCTFIPIPSMSGSGIHVGSNWLEQQNVEKQLRIAVPTYHLHNLKVREWVISLCIKTFGKI